MKVLVIGAGLGGLACAIACKREGLEVVVLERANRIVPIGAGIQAPPNGTRIARQLGYLDKLLERGVIVDEMELRRYANGKHLFSLSAKECMEQYGDLWMVCHRADCHAALWETCMSLGVDLCLDMDVERIDFDTNTVWLEDGDDISGDVIIGADGLYSICRNQLLGTASPAVETGDLAYRASFPAEQLKTLNDGAVDELCSRKQVTVWLGPQKHTVFYPVRGGKEFNLVLIRPDNMAPGERHIEGDVGEMRQSYEGWDETLTKLISCIPRVKKWKLCTHPELKTWTKGCVALLGDSCHPSLPYQAQGAAMAVEDGAVLGKLLGLLNNSSNGTAPAELIPEVLQLYETLRKSRTTVNVQGARSNQKWYQIPDGPEQEARDAEMAGAKLADGLSPTGWRWIDPEYQKELLGHDVVAEAVKAFGEWKTARA
ncbi:FAD-dependent monooxygenase OpS4 [Colletotrichum gloeosporioides]|uniref:FAD-dependent monooxygenase OpS4 n=1 Tax=Colletotrichum gloeosporioides TaxID=474922 RepID=A0A8H4CRU8_COLGL|nr:FAD-dependent monooxygenase OpS4 [Colletotrichum gloeosporioides]KAF3808726.1 FAD-dependent monooxygenase OpS4 [Colletotrichum gloeosporioides]